MGRKPTAPTVTNSSGAPPTTGTKLDWVAVDHFNTGRPQPHIVLRGVGDCDDNLIIARE